MARKLKITIPLLLLCFILVACGEPKVGDIFMLKRTAVGGMDINSMKNAEDEMKAFEELGDPDSAEEYLDLSEIDSFSVGEVVKVTEINDKYNSAQIQRINPKTGSMLKIWIKREELKELGNLNGVK